MPPELRFIYSMFMWVQFGSVKPMYLLLGSPLIVFSQHLTAIVPTKREKPTPTKPVKTWGDKKFKKEFRLAKIPHLFVKTKFQQHVPYLHVKF